MHKGGASILTMVVAVVCDCLCLGVEVRWAWLRWVRLGREWEADRREGGEGGGARVAAAA